MIDNNTIKIKGAAIASCLGYLHFEGHEDTADESNSYDCTVAPNDENIGAVDLWHLRSLAIQKGGLLNSHGRKLGWIKLTGIDELLDFNDHDVEDGGAPAEDGQCPNKNVKSYEQIQKLLESEMQCSKWHIQRERRYLRKKYNASSSNSVSLSRSSSATDLSSCDGSEGVSSIGSISQFVKQQPSPIKSHPKVSFSPLTVPHSPHSRTPNSMSFAKAASSSPEACPSVTPTSSDDSPTSNDGHTSPLTPHSHYDLYPTSEDSVQPPQCKPQHFSFQPKSYLQYQQRYQQKHRLTKARVMKKDRRPQEKKLLVQIATSAFYLVQQDQTRDEKEGRGQRSVPNGRLQCYDGMQDVIAILLLHLESPSLTSLVLKNMIESHLWMYCFVGEKDVGGDERSVVSIESVDNASFKSANSDESDVQDDDTTESVEEINQWGLLSLSFFPMLQVLDDELHAVLVRDESITEDSRFGEVLPIERVWLVAGVLQKWMSAWFCCEDALPVEVVSRLVDFLLASHPFMPL